jgi:hypothetical protein
MAAASLALDDVEQHSFVTKDFRLETPSSPSVTRTRRRCTPMGG